MKVISLHNKDRIESLLRRNAYLHLYAIGDLDDFFWGHTTWYGLRDGEQLVLLYAGTSPPVVLALADEQWEYMRELLRLITPLLPRRFYAHLSEDLADALSAEYQMISHGTHYKMGLRKTELLNEVDISEVEQLREPDMDDLKALYHASYPSNSFDPRMLETGHYYGMRRGSSLVSVAGVHVYSPTYKVAALGNVTTHPMWRRKGLGTKVTAKLCRSLLGTVDHIGLNVKADNIGALSCYEGLGFERIASYEECSCEAKC
ncbi:MAG: GNAT family N-acetyltransferase [Pyrinomonadaceae bacterium]|jgi:predicted GNAT family acetyltransferase